MAASAQLNSQGSPGSNRRSGSLASHSNIIMIGGMVTVLATLLDRLPTPVMDILLACSISLAIAVLVVTLSSSEALELSSFPSLLLFVA